MAKTIRGLLKMIGLYCVAVTGLGMISCQEAIPAVKVLSGNLSYRRGQYQKSILHYLATEDLAEYSLDAVQYNLGNVYFALGEGDAALQAWASAEKLTNDVHTLFRIAFNRGIVYLHWGRYEEAYLSFRRALSLNPADIDSKINLEDSLSLIRSEIAQPGDVPSQNKDDGNSLLLEYIKRKEAEGWLPQDTEGGDVQDW